MKSSTFSLPQRRLLQFSRLPSTYKDAWKRLQFVKFNFSLTVNFCSCLDHIAFSHPKFLRVGTWQKERKYDNLLFTVVGCSLRFFTSLLMSLQWETVRKVEEFPYVKISLYTVLNCVHYPFRGLFASSGIVGISVNNANQCNSRINYRDVY